MPIPKGLFPRIVCRNLGEKLTIAHKALLSWASGGTAVKKTVKLAIKDFPSVPASLQSAADPNHALPEIELDLVALYHQYLDQKLPREAERRPEPLGSRFAT